MVIKYLMVGCVKLIIMNLISNILIDKHEVELPQEGIPSNKNTTTSAIINLTFKLYILEKGFNRYYVDSQSLISNFY